MNLQFILPRLEIDIAERLQAAYFQGGIFYEYAAVPREPLQVRVALFIKIGAHLLDLKIGHIAYAPAQCAFVRTRAAELKTLDKTPLRQRLVGTADHFAQTYSVEVKNRDNMSASGNPYLGLVLDGSQLPAGVNLEQFRMNGSLKQTEGQLVNCYVYLRRFHTFSFPDTKFTSLILPYYTAIGAVFQAKYQY
jgi:hypothetical protein